MKKQALVAAFSLVAPMVLGSTGVFADVTSSDTSVNANFTVSNTNTDNPTPNNPSGSTPDVPGSDNNTNTPLDPTGNFALAYVPYSFSFGDIELATQGSLQKNIELTGGKTLNVGVKDTQHNQTGWTLKATFSGDLASAGATIGTTAETAQTYDSQNQLVPLSDPGMITVANHPSIGSQQQVIMTGNQGNTFSGTYDLNLGTVSLNIPNVNQVNVGETTGHVTWNLEQTPQS
ncbi:WxL domain-containing protein [Enterococcus hirae]|nr:WxL domain-containing protein [Enterococcus hirae]